MMPTALKEWVEKVKGSDARNVLLENRNDVKSCPLCNHNIEDRTISIYEELIHQMYEIYKWCGAHQRHEFSMRDIKHFLDHNGYTRFNDLIQCSNGILYRPMAEDGSKPEKRGKYGMNMARAREFFGGRRTIHLQISMNQITGEWTVLKETTVQNIPPLLLMLTKDGAYDDKVLL